jgi:hypothetical protein
MGLYSRAVLLNKKSEGKGLLKKALDFLNNSTLGNDNRGSPVLNTAQEKEIHYSSTQLKSNSTFLTRPSSSPYQKNIIDEIKQQINLCKINRLPLAIVKISCFSLIRDSISHNKTIDPVVLRDTISAFIDNFLADEAKLISIGKDQYIFTLYNPKSVDPELVVHQLSHALSYYNNDISNDIVIDFHKKIRIYPDHGEDAEILLNSLI